MTDNDNRNYQFTPGSAAKREEYPIIASWIPKGSRVVDLGCGDGSLLLSLKKKGVRGEGIEISESGVAATRKKGLKAQTGRIDTKLPYQNKEFDYALCNVTLQMVMYPEVLLLEMKRVAKYQIISFPNFAFLPNRVELLIRGKLPRTMLYGYSWYSTGHIHQLSIRDFEQFCQENGLTVLRKHYNFPRRVMLLPSRLLRISPNLFSTVAIYLVEGKNK